MQQHSTITLWMDELKPSIRKKLAKIIRSLDSQYLATNVITTILRLFDSPLPLTSIYGYLGMLVLQGHEDLTCNESVINRRRIEVGRQLLQPLFDKKILKRFNSGDQYMVGIEDDKFVLDSVG